MAVVLHRGGHDGRDGGGRHRGPHGGWIDDGNPGPDSSGSDISGSDSGGSDFGSAGDQQPPDHHMNRKEFMIFCHRQEEAYLKKHPGTHLSKAQEIKSV